MLKLLRAAAILIAITGAIDPSFTRTRLAPVPIDVRSADGRLAPQEGFADSGETRALRMALERELQGAISINSASAPQAVVVAGDGLAPPAVPPTGPVSFITPPSITRAAIRILGVRDPQPGLPGWVASVSVDVAGQGMTVGSTTAIVLENEGLELDRAEHKWSSADETFTASLSFTPPAAGVTPLRIRAVEQDVRVDLSQASATTRALAENRRLRVLAFDPRPSWASGFVRRVLEESADFDVVTRVRASKGLEVETGAPPAALTAASLEPFDAVLVGAPEDLGAGDVAALESFARIRGGTVVLVADRRPSGAYSALVGGGTFEETLVEKPLTLVAGDGTRLRAGELTYPRVLPPGAETIAAFPQTGSPRAAVFIVPVGAGRVFFSGALDAWRYRGDDGEVFAGFWRAHVGRAALSAPRPLEATLRPAVPEPGREVRVRAALRATELAREGATASPAIAGEVIDAKGQAQVVRFWPTAETGVFEAVTTAGAPGSYDVRVHTDSGLAFETPLVVREGSPAVRAGVANAASVAAWTGGVTSTAGALGPLVEQLRALPRASASDLYWPMRSAWWPVIVVSLLCLEWGLRRRRGLR